MVSITIRHSVNKNFVLIRVIHEKWQDVNKIYNNTNSEQGWSKKQQQIVNKNLYRIGWKTMVGMEIKINNNVVMYM